VVASKKRVDSSPVKVPTNALANTFIACCIRAMEIKGIDRTTLAKNSGVSYSRVCGMLRGTDQGTLACWAAMFRVLDIHTKCAGPELPSLPPHEQVGWSGTEEAMGQPEAEQCGDPGGGCRCINDRGHNGRHCCEHGSWTNDDDVACKIVKDVEGRLLDVRLGEIERRLGNLENHKHSGQSWVTTGKPVSGGRHS
jgi:hypothetical protein